MMTPKETRFIINAANHLGVDRASSFPTRWAILSRKILHESSILRAENREPTLPGAYERKFTVTDLLGFTGRP
jgi:hypothetical protein